MACQEASVVHHVASILNFVFALLCWIAGSSRGVPLKELNFHAVAFAIYITGISYSAAGHGYMCEEGVVRNDGTVDVLLSRYFVSGILVALLSVIATLRMTLSSLDIVIHASMAFLAQYFWYFAVVKESADERYFWAFSSISVSFTLIIHMVAESRSRDCPEPRMCRRAVVVAVLYMVAFYVITLLGKQYEHAYSEFVQEVILVTVDSFVILFLCLQVVRHSWAEKYGTGRKLRPDMLSSLHASGNVHAFEALEHSLEISDNNTATSLFAKAIHEEHHLPLSAGSTRQ